MIYDVPFRHQQALDPSGLPTITTTLRAIEKAVDEPSAAGRAAPGLQPPS